MDLVGGGVHVNDSGIEAKDDRKGHHVSLPPGMVAQFPWMTAQSEAAARRLITSSLTHLVSTVLRRWSVHANNQQKTRESSCAGFQEHHRLKRTAAVVKKWLVLKTDRATLCALQRWHRGQEEYFASLNVCSTSFLVYTDASTQLVRAHTLWHGQFQNIDSSS